MKATDDEFEAPARFMSLARSGEAKEALARYEKLPAEYKREKVVMLARAGVTGNLIEADPAGSERSIDAFVKKYPSDPAVELAGIDGHLLRKYSEFHKAIDRLGKSKEARVAIGRAIAADPDLAPAYLSLSDIALEEKDFK